MGPYETIRQVLLRFQQGTLSPEEAAREIEGLRIEAIGDFAQVDLGRTVRCGVPEVVLGEGKENGHLAEIAIRCVEVAGRCIITRISPEQRVYVEDRIASMGITLEDHPVARLIVLSRCPPVACTGGVVGIITAGTADIRVAEEARVIAEEMGCRVSTAYDVGAAGIHRLFPAIRDLLDAHVFIVAAGREGTLPAVVAGLVDRPVIGVPVSTGYGYMGQGKAALASMLQSCSVLSVVNIDAGFTAGAFAARIANMVVTE
ncbi:MAG: nickel pincer cofactor biosynthesis protein LarB [Methanoregulaceae archaeon]|nr:nickel pincer cofactor biosynthesis protein LarB [Methanoregulaceae archaeon]